MEGKEDDIERYRKEQLSFRERNALEKKALSDPFLEDALEGSHRISSEEFSTDLNELKKKIEGKSSRSWLTPLRIAAGVVILIGTASIFFWIDLSEPATMALEKNSSVVADSVVNEKKDDSTRSLLSLDKSDQAPPTSEPVVKKPSKKKIKPSSKKANETALNLSTATVSGSKTDETEIVKEEEEAAVEEIKVAEAPKIEVSPAVALKEESKKESDVLSRSKMKRAASPTSSDSRSTGFVSDRQTISGQVVSSEDRSPIPGVNVVVKGTTTGTVTDANGKFQISTTEANPQLTFSFIGFSTVEAQSQGPTLNVEMQDDVSQLSEVVVTGYGASTDNKEREPVVKSAYPTGGLRAYNKYLEDNLRFPTEALESNIKGKVTVEFTIATNGNLSDFNILKGLGHGCDEEVIRLVKEGPKWNPTTVDNVSVETQVRVRMKFDPAKAKK